MAELDERTDLDKRLDHIDCNIHEVLQEIQAFKHKIEHWEARAEPLLRLRETARNLRTLGKGRDGSRD